MSMVRKALGFARVGVAMAKTGVRKLVEKSDPAAAARPIPKGEERDYTLAELRTFDGSDPERPILMAVRGKVFDVTRGREFYGPGGPYGIFAGRDCTRALAKYSFDERDCVGDVSGLDADELDKLEDWIANFEAKYIVLGNLIEEDGPKPSA